MLPTTALPLNPQQLAGLSLPLAFNTAVSFVTNTNWQAYSGEARLIDANTPVQAPRLFLPRQVDHEYSLDHYRGRFYVRSNKDGKNFGLYETRESPATFQV